MVVALRYIFATLLYCVCVLSCIDTHHFVYTSLSQSLYPSIVGLLTVVGFMLVCLFKKKIPDFNKIQVLALILAAYIFLHGMIKDAEIYKQGYTISTLLSMVALAGLMKVNIISERHVEYGIIMVSVVNIAYLVAQLFNFIESGNPFFQLSGANENPNTVAMALTIGIPFVIQKMKERRLFYVMTALLLLAVGFLISLKCRTAFNGIACIIVCYSLIIPKTRHFLQARTKSKSGQFLIFCIVIVFSALFYISYNMKKDSADGRFFIWQRNMEMISENPIGYGYGKYEVEYNLYQSQYFASHKDEYATSTIATSSNIAYNDMMEHAVQGGVLGGILCVSVLILPAILAFRRKKWTCFVAMSSVIVMSMSDTICYSISPWIMTVMTMALVANSSDVYSRQTSISVNYISFIMLLVMSVPVLGRDIQLANSQKTLKIIQEGDDFDIEDICSLYPSIGTSEAYWNYAAECNERMRNFGAADSCYTQARKYTSAPSVLYKSAMCKENIGDRLAALKIMQTVVCMLPRNFSAKYHLMMMYRRMNDYHHARLVAQKIVSTPEKIHNESVHFIKEEAERILKE